MQNTLEPYEPIPQICLSKTIYIYSAAPCDFWADCIIADPLEASIILKLMPEEARNRTVYKSYLPGNGCDLEVFYFCKADNNGTTYIFSNQGGMENEGLHWELENVVGNLTFDY